MPELEQKSFQKRQVAYKVRISDILNSKFIKDEFISGYIRLNDAIVARVNIMGTVVHKTEQSSNYSSAIVDDGTGKILLRSFENSLSFQNVDVGDAVLAVGRVREFNSERYIMPEILKKINNFEWLNVRKLELKDFNVVYQEDEKQKSRISEENTEKIVEPNIYESVYSLIRSLDSGNGVLVEDVIKKSNNSEAEVIINKLLESGDIFEISSGKIKVLE